MSTFDDVVSGLNVGMGLRGAFDKRQDAKAVKKQQEMLGGLRRTSLFGETEEARQTAQKELLVADPEAHKAFTTQFENLNTFEQGKLKDRNAKLGLAETDLIKMNDADLQVGLARQAQVFEDMGYPQLAAQTGELSMMAGDDVNGVRAQLQGFETQARDIEKVIASQEKFRKELVDAGQSSLDARLKALDGNFDKTKELRKDVNSTSKEFFKVRDAFGRIESIFSSNEEARAEAENAFSVAVQNNPQAYKDIADSTEAFGDMALIFNYMKMLDPGSTVREGEFANAQNTGGVDEKTMNLYNSLMKGTRLTEEQRQGILNQSNGLMKSSSSQNKKDVARYRRTAKRYDLPMNEIFVDEEGEGGDKKTQPTMEEIAKAGQDSRDKKALQTNSGIAFTRGE
jgi:hypothetical protein